jgi:hypothetical protein
MDWLALRREGVEILVEADTLHQQDLNTARWKAAFIAV